MEIVVPGTAKEFDKLFRQSYSNGLPTYYRLSEYSNDESLDVGFGKVLPLYGTGSRFTILGSGPALSCIEKAGLLSDESVNVLYCITVAPLDMYTIGNSAPNGKLMIVESYYSAIFPEIVNSLDVKVVSVCPSKEFVEVGFDLEKAMVNKIHNIIRRLRW